MIEHILNLNVNIEEADERLIPHAIHAIMNGNSRIVILSSDTDVFVGALYFWNLFHSHGLKEFWMRAGVGDTTRYVPLHILGGKVPNLCKVLPAAHALTGCDITSKVGTKLAALKVGPEKYLEHFGKTTNEAEMSNSIEAAETYLVNVIKAGTPCKTMDELRHWIYHQGKNVTITQLPPTSREIYQHILRSYYATFMQVSCLSGETIDPQSFGFERVDELMMPVRDMKLVPDDLFPSCTCKNCSTVRCACRKNYVPCCEFCKCKFVVQQGENIDICKNPN